MSGRDAVGVLVDEKLAVGSVDRVVQDGRCSRISTLGDRAERTVERQGVAHLGGHGVADAFLGAAFGYVRAVWVAERDADLDAWRPLSARMRRSPASSARKRAL